MFAASVDFRSLPDFMTEWWFMGLMVLVLAGLLLLALGLFIFILIRISRK